MMARLNHEGGQGGAFEQLATDNGWRTGAVRRAGGGARRRRVDAVAPESASVGWRAGRAGSAYAGDGGARRRRRADHPGGRSPVRRVRAGVCPCAGSLFPDGFAQAQRVRGTGGVGGRGGVAAGPSAPVVFAAPTGCRTLATVARRPAADPA